MSQKMINQRTRTTDRSFPRISLFLDNLEEGGVQRGVVNLYQVASKSVTLKSYVPAT